MMDRLRAQPIVALNRLQTLPAMHMRVDSTGALMALAADGSVGRIVMNDQHQLMDGTPADLTLINQPQAAAAGKQGAGATVAVLDTGTDYKRAPFNCTAAGATGCPVVYARTSPPATTTSMTTATAPTCPASCCRSPRGAGSRRSTCSTAAGLDQRHPGRHQLDHPEQGASTTSSPST